MRELRIIVVLTAAVLASAAITVAGRQQQNEPAISPERLAEITAIRPVPGKGGLYVIPGFDGATTGGNVAVRVTDDGIILVDDKFPQSFEMVTEEVKKVASQQVRYVLDTHHHDDHSGSNADFMRAAEVIAHRNARANIEPLPYPLNPAYSFSATLPRPGRASPRRA